MPSDELTDLIRDVHASLEATRTDIEIENVKRDARIAASNRAIEASQDAIKTNKRALKWMAAAASLAVVVGSFGVAVGWNGNTTAHNAKTALVEGRAALIESRVRSCNGNNEIEKRQAAGAKREIRILIKTLAAGSTDPDKDAKVAAFYKSYDAQVDKDHKQFVCSIAAINERLGPLPSQG